MSFSGVYDDGRNDLVDEAGQPVMDGCDNVIPLESLKSTENKISHPNDDCSISKVKTETGVSKASEAAVTARKYRKYTLEDRESFFALRVERPGDSINSCARELDIQSRTAQRWVKESEENGDGELPVPKKRGKQSANLNDDHKDVLFGFVEGNPSILVQIMMEKLSQDFEGMNVGKSTLQKFLKDECAFTFKLAGRESVDRNSDQRIDARFEFADGLTKSDVDFRQNCVFVDEAIFEIYIKRTGRWAKNGEPPNKSSLTGTHNRTLLGAICYEGVVQLSLCKPKAPAQLKGKVIDALMITTKGIGHYRQFILDLMKVLGKHPQFRNSYIVTDNAKIKNKGISSIIEAHGYRCLYLPPVPLDLNPVEQFWSDLKSNLGRKKLLKEETLTTRIQDAARRIPLWTIRHSIEHSLRCLDVCREKKPLG